MCEAEVCGDARVKVREVGGSSAASRLRSHLCSWLGGGEKRASGVN